MVRGTRTTSTLLALAETSQSINVGLWLEPNCVTLETIQMYCTFFFT